MFGKTQNQTQWLQFVLAGAIGCATLWDFRFHDIRLFDMTGLAMFAGLFLQEREPLADWLRRRQRVLLLYGVVIGYAAIGFILHVHRSSLAIIILGFVGFALSGRRDFFKSTNLFRWLAIGHILFFLVQFIAYYFLRETIDIYQLLGTPSRIHRSPIEIRAAGLFQEPNSYCLNLFLLTTLATLQRSSRVLVFFAAATMVLSQSLWGVAAAFVLVLMSEARDATSVYRLIAIYLLTALAVATIFNIYLWTTKPKSDNIPFFYVRIMQIIKDPSFHDRYIGDICVATGHSKELTEPEIPNRTQLLPLIFGEGLTTAFFLECLPANGGAFLLKSFGLFGLIASGFGLTTALRGAAVRDRIFIFVAIVFSFTTYPLITYLIFWIWLASLIGIANERGAVFSSTSGAPAQ